MAILAHYQTYTVEVLDVYQAGGVKLASVKALEGEPFTGGDKWPVPTKWATVKAADLAGVMVTNMPAAQVLAILAAYRKAQAAAQAGRLESERVNKALALAITGERRPYKTTPAGCSCPDSKGGQYCKHRIAALILQRAGLAVAA